MLTPNFGYLLGLYPLIKIIDNLHTRNKINVGNFLKNGFIAIGAMHLTGIFYNFIQIIFYSQYNLFLYNLGKYSLGKIGYHFLMLFPLLLLIKPIERLKRSIGLISNKSGKSIKKWYPILPKEYFPKLYKNKLYWL